MFNTPLISHRSSTGVKNDVGCLQIGRGASAPVSLAVASPRHSSPFTSSPLVAPFASAAAASHGRAVVIIVCITFIIALHGETSNQRHLVYGSMRDNYMYRLLSQCKWKMFINQLRRLRTPAKPDSSCGPRPLMAA